MKKPGLILIVACFLLNTLAPIPYAQAQEYKLPQAGVMVHLSPPFNPPILKGIKVHPDNPFLFDFILDEGDRQPGDMASAVSRATVSVGQYDPSTLPSKFRNEGESDPEAKTDAIAKIELKQESTKLIKYFLASLTIPENDLWVNLSPSDRAKRF